MASLGGWWTKSTLHFPANDSERGTYLGPAPPDRRLVRVGPTQVARRTLVAVAFIVAVVAALGSWLTVNGKELFVLYPGAWLAAKPFFKQAMPVRLMVFAALAGAVMTAMWAASGRRPRWLRIALPALAALAIAPNVSWGAWARTPEVPRLFDEHVQELHRPGPERTAPPVRDARRLDDVAGADRFLVPRRGRLHLPVPSRRTPG
jgi:hypothetical protein